MDARVLIAEDDPDLNRMLSSLLSSWGYRPVGTDNGIEALSILTGADPPPLALLDWMMPGATGLEVCRAVRAREGATRPFIVILTARAGAEDAVIGLEAGADDYITKPFDFGELRARLTRGTQRDPEPERIAPGSLLGQRWELERLIGEGGMGSVWLAKHHRLHHPVAIKLIRAELAGSSLARARFETEAQIASGLRSPHLPHVFDFGITQGGSPYLAMEYLIGVSLEARIQEHGPLSLRETAIIVSQIARGLHTAHESGIVHRDVKPSNVFLAELGEDSLIGLPYVAKLLDFGIAKQLLPARGHTPDGGVLGTIGYAAPELLMGEESSWRIDQWSLAATAFAALVGHGPFDGGSGGRGLLNVLAGKTPSIVCERPDLPDEIDGWFARACARDPSQRFETMLEMARALRRLAEANGHSSIPSIVAPGPIRRSREPGRADPLLGSAPTALAPRPPAPRPGEARELPRPAPVPSEVASRASSRPLLDRRGEPRGWPERRTAFAVAVGLATLILVCLVAWTMFAERAISQAPDAVMRQGSAASSGSRTIASMWRSADRSWGSLEIAPPRTHRARIGAASSRRSARTSAAA